MQLDFFHDPVNQPNSGAHKDGSGSKDALRPYQCRIVEEAILALARGESVRIEMATGTGKTRVGAEIVKRLLLQMQGTGTPMRVLWLAHRIELVRQATGAISRVVSGSAVGQVGQEVPDVHSQGESVVVASKDTIRQPARLTRLSDRFDPFRAIFVDEGHHATASSYQRIFDTWPDANLVRLSATFDRLDRRKFVRDEYATTPYTIVEAISDAYLVPVKAKRVKVESIDISHVRTVGGDFAQDELEAVIRSEQSLYGIATGLLQECGTRPTIVFCSGVDSAERLVEILHRTKPLCARLVMGKTDPDLRAEAFRNFGKDYQFLVNVGVATEGTDLPIASCVAMVRLTKSRALFSQMLGRVLRPLPGLYGDSPEARQTWIRSSPKPFALVLDFCGNTGKHSVITVADVATSNEKVAKKVRARIEAGEEYIDVFDAIRRQESRESAAQERRQAKKAAEEDRRCTLSGNATVQVTDTELIGLSTRADTDSGWTDSSMDQALTPGQVTEGLRLGIAGSVLAGLSRRDARKAIMAKRAELALATPGQVRFLLKRCPDKVHPGLTKKQAQGLFLGLKRMW